MQHFGSILWRDPVFNLHGTHWWSMGQSMVLEVCFDFNILDHQRDLRHGHLWANDLTPKGLVKGKIPAKGSDFRLVNWNYTPRNWNIAPQKKNWNIAPKKKKSRWFIFVFSHTHRDMYEVMSTHTYLLLTYIWDVLEVDCVSNWVLSLQLISWCIILCGSTYVLRYGY